MDIKFSLMSIISVAVLLFFSLQSGNVALHSIEFGFSINSKKITVTIDPTWVVWADKLYPNSLWGMTFGNVAVINKSIKNTIYAAWVERFELNHVAQYRALGWWSYPAGFFLPIDPMYYCPQHWDDPTEADRVEWLPPDGWNDLWHWLAITWNIPN